MGHRRMEEDEGPHQISVNRRLDMTSTFVDAYFVADNA
jgi:hypothetical protein